MPFPSLLAVANPTYLDFFAALKYLIHSLGVMRILLAPATQGPGKQPAHLLLPLFSNVEEELSSSAHTRTLLSALAES